MTVAGMMTAYYRLCRLFRDNIHRSLRILGYIKRELVVGVLYLKAGRDGLRFGPTSMVDVVGVGVAGRQQGPAATETGWISDKRLGEI